MPSYDLTGNVKLILDTQTFDSGFTKREFVVTTEEDRYPQDIKLSFVKDKITQLDSIKAGQRVTVSFDLRGNEYNGRYFVDLTAWRIQPADQSGGGTGGGDSVPIDAYQERGSEELDPSPF